ncbi:gibberellin 2-beta-dioxygenase 8-like protein, partial [Trifolium pratense]
MQTMDSISDPPFEEAYKNLLNKTQNNSNDFHNGIEKFAVVEERELPMIDLSRLENEDEMVREECKFEIAKASQEWGFFQVINHGIPNDIFNKLKSEQEKVFKLPFDKKTKEDKFLQFSSGSYRWGTPSATCVGQLSWSEAFHILLKDVLGSSTQSNTL